MSFMRSLSDAFSTLHAMLESLGVQSSPWIESGKKGCRLNSALSLTGDGHGSAPAARSLASDPGGKHHASDLGDANSRGRVL